jgi:hypothetical protein
MDEIMNRGEIAYICMGGVTARICNMNGDPLALRVHVERMQTADVEAGSERDM